ERRFLREPPMSMADIASEMGYPPDTVWTWHSRLVPILAERLSGVEAPTATSGAELIRQVQREDAAALERAIRQLGNAAEKKCIRLRFVHKPPMSIAEVAAAMGRSE